MKTDIHPTYVECAVSCVCGNSFTTKAALPEIKIEICNVCHPFFTGKQKIIDTAGRVERFMRKYGIEDGEAEAAPAAADDEVEAEAAPATADDEVEAEAAPAAADDDVEAEAAPAAADDEVEAEAAPAAADDEVEAEAASADDDADDEAEQTADA